MELHDLSFAQIFILQDDIAEIIVNEGVELDEAMVKEFHLALLTHLNPPFSVLVNKKNSYTYDFSAQQILGTLPQINAIAVVVYNSIALKTTEILASYPRENKWHMELFSARKDALAWLIQEQEIVNQIKLSC